MKYTIKRSGKNMNVYILRIFLVMLFCISPLCFQTIVAKEVNSTILEYPDIWGISLKETKYINMSREEKREIYWASLLGKRYNITWWKDKNLPFGGYRFLKDKNGIPWACILDLERESSIDDAKKRLLVFLDGNLNQKAMFTIGGYDNGHDFSLLRFRKYKSFRTQHIFTYGLISNNIAIYEILWRDYLDNAVPTRISGTLKVYDRHGNVIVNSPKLLDCLRRIYLSKDGRRYALLFYPTNNEVKYGTFCDEGTEVIFKEFNSDVRGGGKEIKRIRIGGGIEKSILAGTDLYMVGWGDSNAGYDEIIHLLNARKDFVIISDTNPMVDP